MPLALGQYESQKTQMLRSSLILVILLWCAGLGAAAQFSKISLVYPELEAFYTNGEASPLFGFVLSIISFLGIVFGLTAGLIVARVGFRKMLIAGLLLGAGIAVAEASLPPLPVMMGLRLIEGASHLIITVAAPTLIAQITAARFASVAMSLWSTFFGVAYALTAWFGAPLVAAYGVPAIFYTHAVWMITIAALLFVALPKETGQTTSKITNLLRQHVLVYTNPATSAPALAWLCYTLTFVSLLTILPPFIAEQHRTLTVSLMPLAGIATSMTIGVILLNWMSPVKVVVIGFALAAVMVVSLAITPGNPIFCIALFATLGLVQGANFAAIPALNETATDRAHANGAVAQMGNLGNTFGTPIVLILISVMGFTGIVLFALTAYGLGIVAHLLLARLRS
jgi:predicted MFS family arabinose efflux permease